MNFWYMALPSQCKAVSTQRENHFHMNDIQFSGTEMDECEIFLTFYSFQVFLFYNKMEKWGNVSHNVIVKLQTFWFLVVSYSA